MRRAKEGRSMKQHSTDIHPQNMSCTLTFIIIIIDKNPLTYFSS